MDVNWSHRGIRIVGVLDVGSSKTACLIALLGPRTNSPDGAGGRMRVIGVAQQRSRGITAGVITDLEKAEETVRATIAQAEAIAGVTLKDIVVSVSCGRLQSHNFSATARVPSGVVTESDVFRVMQAGQSYAERDGRTLVHVNRLGFRLDGAPGMQDPHGMAAKKLSADLHAVTGDDAPIRNLLLIVERCYLSVASLVASPFASALATTTEDERRIGVTCIDLGAGLTTLAAFCDGHFIFTDAVPVGGSHITFDIARALQTPLAEAERIKALYGTVVGAQSNEHETVSYPLAGEEAGAMYQTTKARLAEIIRPRLEGLATLIGDRIDAAGLGGRIGDQIVITGGASQLVGAGEFVAGVLRRPVRLAKPKAVSGLPPLVSNAAFATAVGLLEVSAYGDAERGTGDRRGGGPRSDSYLERVGQWLREGF